MNEYRVYRLDKDGRVFAPPDSFTCANDDDAMAIARQLVDGYDVELWHESRLVARLTRDGK